MLCELLEKTQRHTNAIRSVTACETPGDSLAKDAVPRKRLLSLCLKGTRPSSELNRPNRHGA